MRAGMRALPVLMLVSVLGALRAGGTELTFELPDSDRQCFHQELERGLKFTLDYQVLPCLCHCLRLCPFLCPLPSVQPPSPMSLPCPHHRPLLVPVTLSTYPQLCAPAHVPQSPWQGCTCTVPMQLPSPPALHQDQFPTLFSCLVVPVLEQALGCDHRSPWLRAGPRQPTLSCDSPLELRAPWGATSPCSRSLGWPWEPWAKAHALTIGFGMCCCISLCR